ncbi:unnamed protein product [Penicillium roqueforti FM164]|uniref:Genomic scaffold, ProqFM164S03 n=1 Tax=Penicillium roqueforti (strain FM164) TaxID=1365484 RepID=W6QAU6_PENRF|nr:unnamed protein product [Penicillium roqueforti FM164]
MSRLSGSRSGWTVMIDLSTRPLLVQHMPLQ